MVAHFWNEVPAIKIIVRLDIKYIVSFFQDFEKYRQLQKLINQKILIIPLQNYE